MIFLMKLVAMKGWRPPSLSRAGELVDRHRSGVAIAS